MNKKDKGETYRNDSNGISGQILVWAIPETTKFLSSHSQLARWLAIYHLTELNDGKKLFHLS